MKMMVRRLPVLLMVMLVGIVGSQRPGDEMPKFPVHGKEMEETKSAEKILIDKDPEFKKHLEEIRGKISIDQDPELRKELEDVEKNGELMEKECFNGYCFEVKQLRRFYNDRDCCCPTISFYYRPLIYVEERLIWIPLYSQWIRIGKCLGLNKVCHKSSWPFIYQKCQQMYQWILVPYFGSSDLFSIKYKYILLPDYCYCPCRYWLPISREPKLE